jgi:hypothetical protein
MPASAADLHLLPRPREVRFGEGSLDFHSLPTREVIDTSLVSLPGDEAYTLELGAGGILLAGRTRKGLALARATLNQLKAHATLPPLVIEDAPRFANRGIMLDISRDRVPTLASLFQLVDTLAAWKMNHLQLYVEHTIAYAGHEDVWRASSPITLDELSALDAHAASRGVSLTANQNCLGHFERWLRHPRYAPLGERSTGGMRNREYFVPPNTLCPSDPGTLSLIRDLLQQQLPRCSGSYANIGCDEPWDLGEGRSRELCSRIGKGRVFSEHVNRVAELCRDLGKIPQFWCDPHPNEGDGLTRDLVALIWGYEQSDTFAPRAEAHLQAGREVWVAPGTSCWGTSTGRTWNRRANLDTASSETRAAGFLCTAWGDGGHRQPWPITLAGFADAAQAAWFGPDAYDEIALGRHAFGCDTFGPWISALGNVDAEICRGEVPDFDATVARGPIVRNKSALWQEMHHNFFERTGVGDIGAWTRVKERLERLAASLPTSLDPHFAEEARLALDLAAWTADRAILRRGSPTVSARQDLAIRMVDMLARHRTQWLRRSRYGGLEDSSLHFSRFCSNW